MTRLRIVGGSLLYVGLLILPSACSARRDMATMDRYFDALESNDRLMGSVTVREHDRVIYQRSLGRAFDGPAGRVRTNADTKFRIGSITKMFTAVMVYQLIDEGKLSLETKLSRFFPRVANADEITIAHLLGHMTGLPDYVPGWKAEVIPARESIVSAIEQLPGRSPPGTKREYSNTNYALLGFIVEDVDGRDYAANLDERIVRRIRLRRAHYGGDVRPENNEARAFYFDEDKWVVQPDDDIRLAGGAGGIVSTTDDLTHFASALFAGRLISAASLSAMMGGKGVGPYTLPQPERKGYAHDGGIGAFSSLLGYIPQEEIAVAITTNGYNYPQNRVFRSIWQILYGTPTEIPSFAAVQLSDSRLRGYAGRFAIQTLVIDVRVEGLGLVAQASGQDSFPLTATGPRSFVYAPAGILIEFDDSADPSPKFTLFQQKNALVLERQKSP